MGPCPGAVSLFSLVVLALLSLFNFLSFVYCVAWADPHVAANDPGERPAAANGGACDAAAVGLPAQLYPLAGLDTHAHDSPGLPPPGGAYLAAMHCDAHVPAALLTPSVTTADPVRDRASWPLCAETDRVRFGPRLVLDPRQHGGPDEQPHSVRQPGGSVESPLPPTRPFHAS